MRFVLGDQDWVLGPGEVASFDTRCRIGSAAPHHRSTLLIRPTEHQA
jgi:hypothetical protein